MLPSDTRLFVWNTNYFRRFGGAERAVHNLVNRFSGLGIETYLIARETTPGRRHNEFFGPLEKGAKIYQGKFVNPWDSSDGPLSFIPNIFRYLVAAFRFGAFFRRNRADIIHLHYVSWDILLLAVYRFFYRFHLVITFRAGEDLIARQRYFSRLKVRIALRFADRVTAVSKDICETIRAKYDFGEVLYIPNGIDVEQVMRSARPRGDVEPDQFVYCGRMAPQKRVDFLVDAFNECIRQGCEKKLYLVGDGEELDIIRDRIRSYGIQDRVILLGALSHAETLGVISQSRCVVLTSVFEGAPQVALEAMALGKAVIASDVGGLKDIILHEESGCLYPVDRRDMCSACIMALCKDAARARSFGARGLAKLKADFSMDSIVEQYLDLYQSLILASPKASRRRQL